MVETFAFPFLRQLFPSQFCSLQHAQSAHHVGLREGERVLDGAVNMALCCEVNHTVDVIFLEDSHNCLKVTDVGFDKGIVRFVFNVFQVGEVACVCQLINVDDMIIRIFVHKKSYNMTSDESCAAGDDDVLHRFLMQLFNDSFQCGIVIFNLFLIFVLSRTE